MLQDRSVRPFDGGSLRAGRRSWLTRASVAVVGIFALGGCGFELRRAPSFAFRTIGLAGFPARSPLADELRSSINASQTTLVIEPALQAQVILHALTDARERSVAASTAAGQVRELQLRTRFSFRLDTPSGKELIPATELLLSRDMSYSEGAALAKEEEEALLFRMMQSDIVSQVMRRLAAVKAI